MQSMAGMQTQTRNIRRRSTARGKKWVVQPACDSCEQLAGSLKVSPLFAQVLINRGIETRSRASAFLNPKLADLISPEEMPGMQKAVGKISSAIKDGQKITIYGDYDVDGITGVAILSQLLELLDADVDFYIPHRIREGYGVNEDAVRSLAENGTNLLVTTDCGISAIDSVLAAGQLGIETVITDHHQPDDTLPQAAAIVHPALDKSYANQDSAGAMVAFKLAWALAIHFNSGPRLDDRFRRFMLDATSLAAMGTIADIMDLRGENRILTSYGLKSLGECSLPGIRALIENAGLDGKGLDSYHIGFRLAPMLNAAGRMGHARLAVELLNSTSTTRAIQIARYLKEQNAQRRKYERKISKHAMRTITEKQLDHPDNQTIVLANEKWHAGVIGVVASRIVDRFYRPTIIINSDTTVCHGSARSIPDFDILKAIKSCRKWLTGFGGHEMAAGISIARENIPEFSAEFEAYAQQNLASHNTTARLHIDSFAALNQLKMPVVTELSRLGPFGTGNPRPVFATKGLRLAASPRRVGSRGEHLQFAVSDNTASIRCIGFGLGKYEKKLVEKDFFDLAYEPAINNFNASSSVQLVVSDIRFE